MAKVSYGSRYKGTLELGEKMVVKELAVPCELGTGLWSQSDQKRRKLEWWPRDDEFVWKTAG